MANQFALLTQRRFAPFFWTQFLGAGNDNLFKFAFTVLVTYQLRVAWLPPAMAGLVIGAVFIFPFLLFSATSGQLADKLEKSSIIRFVKSLEIAIMAVAAWGLLRADVPALLGCIFLMGLHSTLFGPVKYAYLPQHLSERELTGGNGMVEMGTFVAILLGNLAGGLLIAIPRVGSSVVAGSCIGLAVLGRLVAQWVPSSPPTDRALVINWNPVSETWRNLKLARQEPTVFRSLVGISWMWFFGAAFLAQLPSFAKDVLHGDEQLASLLLVVFSVGIGTGSLLCERLSRNHVEIGLVPVGAIGMSAFAIDLSFASTTGASWRVMADLGLLSLFAGLYSVPMYALIQLRSMPSHRARIIAANNILNAMFMIGSSVLVGGLLAAGLTIPQTFFVIGATNAAVAGYVFMLAPEYLLRTAAFIATRFPFSFSVSGEENLPATGAAILVCSGDSLVDALRIATLSPRPITFVIDRRMLRTPLLGRLFRLGGCISVAPQSEGKAPCDAALRRAMRTLDGGGLLAIFPGSTATGDRGIMSALCESAVPVLPVALQSGSHVLSRVRLTIGRPLSPGDGTRQGG